MKLSRAPTIGLLLSFDWGEDLNPVEWKANRAGAELPIVLELLILAVIACEKRILPARQQPSNRWRLGSLGREL